MGATTFSTYADGPDPSAAFNDARDAAAHEHGHRYSGTIADKDGYIVVTRRLMDPDQAEHLAADLIDRDDPRIADKWGPAGAIPIRQPTRTVTIDRLTGTLTDTSTGRTLSEPALRRLTDIARHRDLLTDGETVTAGRLRDWRRTGSGNRYSAGVADLTVTRSPADLHAQSTPDGWLFFGWAST
ncbi:hypothetical protein AB0M46_47470 [Dactylosporangium sp. NPDC051485]|uniref:hypothetical protein n=1 Tax=Dactylosporangium sp. NPDC051485 TaxID=3154846 RepID=UPI0034468E0A